MGEIWNAHKQKSFLKVDVLDHFIHPRTQENIELECFRKVKIDDFLICQYYTLQIIEFRYVSPIGSKFIQDWFTDSRFEHAID